jgi:hypothetical protein
MKSEQWFRSRAKDLHHEGGAVEVDDNARVSIGSGGGAYVEAWVWVPAKEHGDLAGADD